MDRVLVYDAPWMKATAPRLNSAPELAMVQKLKELRFDAAVIFTVYSQAPMPAAFLCYLADIPLRLAHSRENPYQLLTHWVTDPEPNQLIRHEVRRQLDLVAAVGCPSIEERLAVRVRPMVRERMRRWLCDLGLTGQCRWVLVHPGASARSRRYSPEGFAEAARRQAVEDGCTPVFTGSAQEEKLVEQIRAETGVPSYSLAGRLGLEELAALIELSPLLISNNTGPAHLAAAVGTPVVVLYALTNPQHTPWQVPSRVLYHDVPCRNCYKSICPEEHHNCLRLVSSESVVQAARELLEKGRSWSETAAPGQRGPVTANEDLLPGGRSGVKPDAVLAAVEECF